MEDFQFITALEPKLVTPHKDFDDRSHKTLQNKKPTKRLILLIIPSILLVLMLIGSLYTIIFPDSTLVFLKNELPAVFEFFITAEEPEIDKTNWVEIDEEEPISPEEQNSGEVKTNYEEQQTILTIPSADIEIPIVEGETEETMLEGAWHFPKSAPLNSTGNTVIFAHRFHKVPPAKDTFYNLDKVKVGDQIIITNKNDETFKYKVTENKVIAKNDRSILDPTEQEVLTLVTCTPLWTAKKRLIVTAKRL
jgi:sortase A